MRLLSVNFSIFLKSMFCHKNFISKLETLKKEKNNSLKETKLFLLLSQMEHFLNKIFELLGDLAETGIHC